MSRRRLSDSSGLSLVEVMVVIGLISTLVYAMAGMFEQLQKQQTSMQIRDTYQALSAQIRGAVMDKVSWDRTVFHPLNNVAMACLRPGAMGLCQNGLATEFALIESSNNTLYDSIVQNMGFTVRGERCQGSEFVRPNPGPGDDPNSGDSRCPIGFRLQWIPICPVGQAQCLRPSIEIDVIAMWNPGADNPYPTAPGVCKYSFTGPGLPCNPPDVSGRLRRGAGTINEPIVGFEGVTGDGATGECTPGTWASRRINNNLDDVNFDPNDNAQPGPSGSIQLKPGEYECAASMPGYDVGAFQVKLSLGTGTDSTTATPFAHGTGFAASGSQGTAMASGRFTITSSHRLFIDMACEKSGTGTPRYDFGMPAPPYAPGATPPYGSGAFVQRLTNVHCNKIN